MSLKPQIVVIRLHGPNGVVSACVSADRFTVGRVGADYIVEDKGVSRLHLTVHVRDRAIWLEDMGSANGTFIGKMRLQAQTPTPYEAGHEVRLGVCKDLLSFELIEKTKTLKEVDAEAAEFARSPSKALSVQAPSTELAAKADAFLREARETAVGIRDAAAHEAEHIINHARSTAQETIAQARGQVEKMLEEARQYSSDAIIKREAAASEALASARKEAHEIKTSAGEDAERVNKEARLAASQIKLQAQTEAEHILRDARVKAAELEEKAEIESLEIVRQTREKNRAAIEQNELDVDRALREAREAAAKIRSEASEVLEKARTQVKDKGEALLRDARGQAEKIVAQAHSEAGRVREEARAEGLRTIESGLKDAQQEIQRFKDDVRAEIEGLEEQRYSLQTELKDLERRQADLIRTTEERARENVETVRKNEELASAMSALRSEHEKAKADMLLVRTLKETAEKDRETALAARREAESEAERIRRDANAEAERIRREAAEKKESLNKDLKDMRDKAMLEFEDRKKSENQEIANLKLQWIEELKATQVKEEQQQRTLRIHQAKEIARHTEMLLIPLVQRHFPKHEATQFGAELKRDLEPLVKRVMVDEPTDVTNSKILDVISADPVIERLKRRGKMRSRLAIAVPTCAFLVAVLAPGVFDWARKPLAALSKGKTLMEMAAERARELARRKTYDPPQTDELRNSYADCVLYTRDYVKRKLDPETQEKWIRDLNKYLVNDLGLPDQAVVGFISAETNLIRELADLKEKVNPDFEKEGLGRLDELEAARTQELKGKVGGDVAFGKIRQFEKKFFEQMRQPAGQ